MPLYCYPKGFFSTFHDEKIKKEEETGLFTTNGSKVISDLTRRVSEEHKEPAFIAEVISTASRYFRNFPYIFESTIKSPVTSTYIIDCMELLLDCVDEQMDVLPSILLKDQFMDAYPSKTVTTGEMRERILVLKDRIKKGNGIYHAENIVRSFIIYSDDGIKDLVKLLDTFFGYEENVDQYSEKSVNFALAVKMAAMSNNSVFH